MTTAFTHLIPKPVSVQPMAGIFNLTPVVTIFYAAQNLELAAIGEYLATKLRPVSGFELPVSEVVRSSAAGGILLTLGADDDLGAEGYHLEIRADIITLKAAQPAGIFRGIQTLRQCLPPEIEASEVQPGPWEIPCGTIRDYPRFGYRGTMLDVSRHFFGVADVKRYIDLLAYYKLNYFHLHLSDDQGWRLMINSWPNLASHGGSTAVGGGKGGYYTQEEYVDLVAYAQDRYITVVPEFDLPGHTNAALASYPELNCDDQAPELYTGTEVGFSSLCIDKEITYQFLDDVIREVAALTPGPYIHIGGDEAHSTSADDFGKFMARLQPIVAAHGKQVIGWDEIAKSDIGPNTVVQLWRPKDGPDLIKPGMKVIMSPAAKSYLDMKYTDETELGLTWAGTISVKDGYDWDPATQLPGIPEDNLLGVEAPLWSETLETLADIEQLAFPRLLGYAEIGWTPADHRSWDEYRDRLASHGPRFEALGVNFYRSPLVPWA
jgi:hexosaminidase